MKTHAKVLRIHFIQSLPKVRLGASLTRQGQSEVRQVSKFHTWDILNLIQISDLCTVLTTFGFKNSLKTKIHVDGYQFSFGTHGISQQVKFIYCSRQGHQGFLLFLACSKFLKGKSESEVEFEGSNSISKGRAKNKSNK